MRGKELDPKLREMSFHGSQGIVLGHIASTKGMEVDKSKTDLIASLFIHKTIRDIRSFLRHVSFYRRFIRDFGAIFRSLCNLIL